MAQALVRFNDEMYLYLFGKYWYINNPETLRGVFGPDPVVTETSSRPVDRGPDISSGSFLWKDEDDMVIRFMCTSNQTAYPIADSYALDFFQFHGKASRCDALFHGWIKKAAQSGDPIKKP